MTRFLYGAVVGAGFLVFITLLYIVYCRVKKRRDLNRLRSYPVTIELTGVSRVHHSYDYQEPHLLIDDGEENYLGSVGVFAEPQTISKHGLAAGDDPENDQRVWTRSDHISRRSCQTRMIPRMTGQISRICGPGMIKIALRKMIPQMISKFTNICDPRMITVRVTSLITRMIPRMTSQISRICGPAGIIKMQ